jgi:hypothetical protein
MLVFCKIWAVLFLKTNMHLCKKCDMTTKLVLSLEKEVIEIAKDYAKEKGQSLSEIVENYLKSIINERNNWQPYKISPRVQRLRGIIKTTGEIDTKQTLTEELARKYEC